jgi:hypothetical protein
MHKKYCDGEKLDHIFWQIYSFEPPEYERSFLGCRLSVCLSICISLMYENLNGWMDFIHVRYSRINPSQASAL